MSDEDHGRSRKRLRISRACDTCRRRKERCDGGQPSCLRCTAASRTCLYNPHRKRGLRPGYVRTLEIILGLIIESFDGVEEAVASVLRNAAGRSSAPIKQRQNQQRGTAEVRSLLESWRNSMVLEDLQNSLNSSEAVEDEELYISGLDAKLTTTFNRLSQRSRTAQGSNTTVDTSLQSQREETATNAIQTTTQPNAQGSDHETTTMSPRTDLNPYTVLSLPSNWSQLIDTYITDAHSWLPVIQKYTLFRTASLSIRGKAMPNSQVPKMGEVSLLWAVLSYSSYILEYSLHRPSPPEDPGSSSTSFHLIYSRARQLASKHEECYDLESVHASLTFALLEMRRDSWTNAWLWVGRAVYTGNIIGFLSPQNDETRRCLLGCFVLDTLVATKLGFRPYLQRADISRIQNLPDDGPEEWELWRPLPRPGFPLLETPPACPGRVLSTFNDLCYMVAAIGRYSDDSIHPPPQLRNLVSYLSSRDSYVGLSELQSAESLASEPPHILQAKLASVAAYYLLKVNSGVISTSYQSLDSDRSIQKGMDQLFDIVNSSASDNSMFNGPGLPPTLSIFARFIQVNISLPTPNSSAYIHNGTVVVGPQARAEEDNNLSLASVNVSSSSGVHLGPSSAKNVFNNSSDTSHGHIGPLRMEGIRPGEGAILPPAGPHLFVSRLGTALTPSHTTQPCELQRTPISSSRGSQNASQSSNEASSDGLFNQLVALDSSEWPSLSEEFMQNLGLSRDASLFEFQNLLTLHGVD